MRLLDDPPARAVARDREDEARVAALELDGSVVGLGHRRSCASSRSSTQPIGVVRSAVRSGSIAPETIRRSIARVIAT